MKTMVHTWKHLGTPDMGSDAKEELTSPAMSPASYPIIRVM